MTDAMQAWTRVSRTCFMTVLAAAAVAGCGGGDDGAAPPVSSSGPRWSLAMTLDGDASAPVRVAGILAPTADSVGQLTAADLAQDLARIFDGYDVTLNGGTVRVTGVDTDYTLIINSIAPAGYQGCGTCGAGTAVSYAVNATYVKSGTLAGQVIPAQSGTVVVGYRFTRQG